jgi:hypothetical protein
MIIDLTDAKTNQLGRLLEQLPISCTRIAQEISELINSAQVKEPELKKETKIKK